MEFSVLIVCDRYLQRLNVALRNWLGQGLPDDAYEIIISSSLTDDGVRNYVRGLTDAFPSKNIVLVENEPMHTKAEYQLALVQRAKGRVLVLVDADMVFPTDLLPSIANRLDDGICLWAGRAYLTKSLTY